MVLKPFFDLLPATVKALIPDSCFYFEQPDLSGAGSCQELQISNESIKIKPK
jgi:hypothetical protein